MARGELQPSWVRHFQFQCLRDLRRWRPDGGCGERSCFARGTSEALQSLLDLRQKQGDYGWPEDAKFLVPDGVYDQFKNGVGKRGAEARAAWNAKYEEYKKQFPQLADQLNKMQSGQLPDGWDKDLPSFPVDPKGMATRESSGKA